MKLNQKIDHTLLSPFATNKEIKKLCQEAITYSFYAVCISPYHATMANQILSSTPIKIAIVVGFPYGYNLINSKRETILSASTLVDEIDVVINLQAVINEDWTIVSKEISNLTKLAHEKELIIKWIVESGNISKDQLLRLCDYANKNTIDFMKTSSGVLGQGASLEAVHLMRRELETQIQIKASGGIRDNKTALDFLSAGADRIGASKSVAIVSA